MTNWGNIPHGTVIPFFFGAYAGGTGASVTLTGIATTDIEVYKGTSMTQRASDNGYALLDTDGIDVDGITGIHGFSIDTSDNSDSGFYAAGSLYTVVLASVTIDSQTVNAVIGTFRLVAAESVAGVTEVDVTHVAGTAQTARDLGAQLDAAVTTRATPAQVNTEVLDVMNTDTFAEPGQGAPAATTTIFTKINYLYKAWRNKTTNDGATTKLYNDAGDTVDQKQTTSGGSTVTKEEFVAGP